MSEDELALAMSKLAFFLGEQDLGERLRTLEHHLIDQDAETAGAIVAAAGVDADLLRGAFAVRSRLGKLNDVIHAAAISLVLPHILEPGERITNRPSLGAGNDPERKFDLETDRRVAEFKLSRWQGPDAARKRGAFKDVVTLLLDGGDRRKQLFVLGERPLRFLRGSRSPVSWALDRSSQALHERFQERWGDLSTSVADFMATEGADVELVDLEESLPELFSETLAPSRRVSEFSSPRPQGHPEGVPRTHGTPGSAPTGWSTAELRVELDRYRRELESAGLTPTSVHTYTQHPERFLRWLIGRYEPRGPNY